MLNHDRSHDLVDFMSQISQDMASEYNRIQKRVTEDPGTAGDQGEENWATLLRDWLPSTYHIVTKGRIISSDGRTSPQIDVLVLTASYPKKLRDKKVYLAAGVAAAFECKITLKSAHIAEAIANCVKIKELFPKRKGSPYKELHSPIVYGLLAHSHTWKGESSCPEKNIKDRLIEEDSDQIDHPSKMIDIVCVADLATWVSYIMTLYSPSGSAATSYIDFTKNDTNQSNSFTSVGTFISYLSRKLAWENHEYRSLADYYQAAKISGSGRGKLRPWDKTIYSDRIRPRVEQGGLKNGVPWDEWSLDFP